MLLNSISELTQMWIGIGSMFRISVRGGVKVRVSLSCRTTIRVEMSGGVGVDAYVRYRRWGYKGQRKGVRVRVMVS